MTLRNTLIVFSALLGGCHLAQPPLPVEVISLETPAFVTRRNFTPSDTVVIEPAYETMLCAGCEGHPGVDAGDTVFWIRFKPGAPESRAMPVEDKTRPDLQTVRHTHHFAFDQFRLEGDPAPLRAILDTARQSLLPIRIIGHTDSRGPEDYNRKLSLKRAQAVADWLIARGIDAERIAVSGEGEQAPVASNRTAEGRAANRRAEVSLTVRVMP